MAVMTCARLACQQCLEAFRMQDGCPSKRCLVVRRGGMIRCWDCAWGSLRQRVLSSTTHMHVGKQDGLLGAVHSRHAGEGREDMACYEHK